MLDKFLVHIVLIALKMFRTRLEDLHTSWGDALIYLMDQLISQLESVFEAIDRGETFESVAARQEVPVFINAPRAPEEPPAAAE